MMVATKGGKGKILTVRDIVGCKIGWGEEKNEGSTLCQQILWFTSWASPRK